jgi:branched-subunit amino acid aminotransferase/4-amino-4-deoxychorismate lyase
MSLQNPPTAIVYRWQAGALVALEDCDLTESRIVVADSWFVADGSALALGMHRLRFIEGVPAKLLDDTAAEAFWDAAIAHIPREGDWFPRVELRENSQGGLSFLLRLRSAPERHRSAVVATWRGDDPRTNPRVKGPDLGAMTRIRTAVQPIGADEAVILSPEGYIVEGAYSSLVWWRGKILCAPATELARVDSVTAKAFLGIAGALGTEVHFEAVTPAEIDGTELWILNALHGPRIVTTWVDGPSLAELPGRLALWRDRLDALRRPLP